MGLPFLKKGPRLSALVATVPLSHHAPAFTRFSRRRDIPAVLIPGDTVLETTAIGGTATFLSIYQNVIGKLYLPPPHRVSSLFSLLFYLFLYLSMNANSIVFAVWWSLVARILLSWFPGVQGNALVRPIITVCDPYLNLFRNVIPPIFGLDLSPVLALLLLQACSSVSETRTKPPALFFFCKHVII